MKTMRIATQKRARSIGENGTCGGHGKNRDITTGEFDRKIDHANRVNYQFLTLCTFQGEGGGDKEWKGSQGEGDEKRGEREGERERERERIQGHPPSPPPPPPPPPPPYPSSSPWTDLTPSGGSEGHRFFAAQGHEMAPLVTRYANPRGNPPVVTISSLSIFTIHFLSNSFILKTIK